MISPTRVLEVKAKGDACNRTARFRKHDLNEVYCGYHGSRPCSEESEDRVRPRKKRNRSASDSMSSSSSSKKSTSSSSSSSGKARSSASKAVLLKLSASSRRSPLNKSSEKSASKAETTSSKKVEAGTSSKREPTGLPMKVQSICIPPAPEVRSSPVASTSHLSDLLEPESATVTVNDAFGSVHSTGVPMDESSPIAEVFTVPYEYPALEEVFQDPGPAIPSLIDIFPDSSYFEPLSPPVSSSCSISSASNSPRSSAYSSCASPSTILMLTPDTVPDVFYLGNACIAPSLVGSMTRIATAAATSESAFSGLLAAVTTTPYWFPEPDTVATPCFENSWGQWSPSDQKAFPAYPSPFSS
ncbi:BQ2448_6508 [Microbotryum intermedium]|uniref:BQ2448_6508 protein n=1 Tax=Microbotryum intermedium TaxID=269621 RepID=A0A238FSI9_9BASI|nr:BQ2448_6508 [Microbotryum intermedium]